MLSKILNKPVLIAVPIALLTFLTTKYLEEVYGWITGSQQLEEFQKILPYGTLLRACLWLSAGIVVILAFLYSKHREQKQSPHEEKQQALVESAAQPFPSDAPYCSRPTPKEIYDQIWEQPPLLQSKFAENFHGINVKWVGTFVSADDEGNENVTVGVSCDGSCFYFTASLTDHPIFRTLKCDAARLQVTGTVKSATNAIELENAKFIFLEEPK
jgi:hypothetical protein